MWSESKLVRHRFIKFNFYANRYDAHKCICDGWGAIQCGKQVTVCTLRLRSTPMETKMSVSALGLLDGKHSTESSPEIQIVNIASSNEIKAIKLPYWKRFRSWDKITIWNRKENVIRRTELGIDWSAAKLSHPYAHIHTPTYILLRLICPWIELQAKGTSTVLNYSRIMVFLWIALGEILKLNRFIDHIDALPHIVSRFTDFL